MTPFGAGNSSVAAAGRTILHWYDLTCPFCYLAQPRNDALVSARATLVELAYQAHPDLPPEGVVMGRRAGPMYDAIARDAEEAGLPLHWQYKLPNSRLALAAVEAARSAAPAGTTDAFRRGLFSAHFAEGFDIGDPAVISSLALKAGVAAGLVEDGWRDGSAFQRLDVSQRSGRAAGVEGTPAWKIGDRLVVGLQPADTLLAIAEEGS